MKRLFSSLLPGLIIALLGLLLAVISQPGSGTAASTPEPPTIDGQVMSSTAVSEAARPDTPAAPGPTMYRTIPSFEFHPTTSNLTYSSYGSAIYALAIPGGGFSIKAEVDLPNGAQVTRITVYVVDNSSTDNMSIQFYRTQLSTSDQIELDSVSTAALPTSTAVQTVSMSGTPIAIIDNSQYAYCLRYGPVITGNAHMLVGARVDFNVPTGFLPLILK
jgi:hypothetical protein